MRILLVVLQFPPDVNSTGTLMDQLIRELVSMGHEPSVITTFPHYEDFSTWPEYRGKLRQRSREDGIDVTRVYSYTGKKKTLVRRLLNYLTFNLNALLVGLFIRPRVDVIVATSGSFFSGVTAYLIGRIHRAPFVYNVQDLVPDVPVHTEQLRNPLAIRLLEVIERFMYKKASCVTTITPSFKDQIVNRGIEPDKVRVIPNFVDVSFIRPLPKVNDFSQAQGLVDRFVVCHAGNIGFVHDLTSLIHAADHLRGDARFLFLIVGSGVTKQDLEDLTKAKDLTNVRFLPFQPMEILPMMRATADVHLSLQRREAGFSSLPSKIYEIMASGRPVLASSDRSSDTWKLIEETGCGICVEPEDPGALTVALKKLADDPDLCHDMGARGRKVAEERFSKERVAHQYADLLHDIVTDR